MRKEMFTVGSFVHVYNRGNRKQPIVRDEKDKWHFLEMLYYFNDEFSVPNPFREIRELLKLNFNKPFGRPVEWPPRRTLVKILAFSLLENHFHLFLKEIREGGITTFMRRLGTGMANYFNTKYQEVGSLFQGSYKAKVVDKDIYLQYLSVYIQVKNMFELYPGGLERAIKEFDGAYDWVVHCPYSSLADYAGKRNSPIIDKDILGDFFSDPEKYREFSRQCLTGLSLEKRLGDLILETN